jgi:hypothetical protein
MASADTPLLRLFVPQGETCHPARDLDRSLNSRQLVFNVPFTVLQPNPTSINQFHGQLLQAQDFKTGLHTGVRIVQPLTMTPLRDKVLGWFEMVPHEMHDLNQLFVGARIHVHILETDENEYCPGDELANILNENEDLVHQFQCGYESAMSRTSRLGQRKEVMADDDPANFFWFRKLRSLMDWLTAASSMNTGIDLCGVQDCREYRLRARENPANPYYVYSLFMAMKSMPHAHRDCINIDKYVQIDEDGHKSLSFPFPKFVWELKPEQLRPQYLFGCYFPSIRRPLTLDVTADNDVFRQFLASEYHSAYADMDTDEDKRANADEDEKKQEHGAHHKMARQIQLSAIAHAQRSQPQVLLYHLVQQRALFDAGMSAESIARRNRQARDSIRDQMRSLRLRSKGIAGGGISEQAIHQGARRAREQFEKKGVDRMAALFNINSPHSKEYKAVIQWRNHWLQTHPNLAGHVDKMTDNLPLEAELEVAEQFEYEYVYLVHVAHSMMRLVDLSMLDAYHPDRTNALHYIALGAAGKSKSAVLDVAVKRSIEGTTMVCTSRSKMADTGVTTMDHSRFVFHEMMETWIAKKATGGPSAAAPPELAYFKDRLSRGEFNPSWVIIDPVTSQRKRLDPSIPCKCTYQMNSNMFENDVEESIKDRCLIGRFTLTNRQDKTLLDIMAIPEDEERKARIEWCTQQARRRQCLFACTGKLIEVGELPRVDLRLAHLYAVRILFRAHGLGMGKSESPRFYNRLMRVTHNLVIKSANYILFDSILSPIRDRPHEDRFFYLLAPLLRATRQHVVMALGDLRKSDLEQPLYTQVLQVLRERMFPVHPAVLQQGKHAKSKQRFLPEVRAVRTRFDAVPMADKEHEHEPEAEILADPGFSIDLQKEWNSVCDAATDRLLDQPVASAEPESRPHDELVEEQEQKTTSEGTGVTDVKAHKTEASKKKKKNQGRKGAGAGTGAHHEFTAMQMRFMLRSYYLKLSPATPAPSHRSPFGSSSSWSAFGNGGFPLPSDVNGSGSGSGSSSGSSYSHRSRPMDDKEDGVSKHATSADAQAADAYEVYDPELDIPGVDDNGVMSPAHAHAKQYRYNRDYIECANFFAPRMRAHENKKTAAAASTKGKQKAKDMDTGGDDDHDRDDSTTLRAALFQSTFSKDGGGSSSTQGRRSMSKHEKLTRLAQAITRHIK